jgi:hypothetical protein
MTKRDYQMVAAVLNQRRNSFLIDAAQDISLASQRLFENYADGIERTAKALADEFEKENPRFDRPRFMIAVKAAPVS